MDNKETARELFSLLETNQDFFFEEKCSGLCGFVHLLNDEGIIDKLEHDKYLEFIYYIKQQILKTGDLYLWEPGNIEARLDFLHRFYKEESSNATNNTN